MPTVDIHGDKNNNNNLIIDKFVAVIDYCYYSK